MKRTMLIAGLALFAAAPLAAQDAPRTYRYRIEAPYRDFGRMGREYGRMGREYARLYTRDWARQWSRNDFGRSYQRYYRGMGRNWSRMGREFRGRDYGRMGREFGRMGREYGRMGRDMRRDDIRFRVRHHHRRGDI